MSKNRNGDDFDFDDNRPSPNGRKKDRREKRHDAKHHMRDIKHMLDSGEDIDDFIDELENEE